MASMQQAHVIAGFFQELGAAGEVLRHVVHILLCHGADLHAVPVTVEVHGTDGLAAVVRVGRGVHAGVVQLVGGDGAALVDRHGDFGQVRQE